LKFILSVFVLDPCERLRANGNRGECQVGLRAKLHGVLGRGDWYCFGMVRCTGEVCGGEGFLAGRFVRLVRPGCGFWGLHKIGTWALASCHPFLVL
nr:hypothetical protein [Tanacetum cinerariifolium]